jgi:transcriptional regulator with XRE-family HTH domain
MLTLAPNTRVTSPLLKGGRVQQLQVHAPRAGDASASPVAHRLRADAAAHARHGSRTTEVVDDLRVGVGDVHGSSVNQLTVNLQSSFRSDPYASKMDLHKLLTPQDRIAWAIERAKANGLAPEELARKAGLSRPGMLHWTKETTNVMGIGIGHLMQFAQAAGVNLDWIVSGRGDPVRPYTSSAEAQELAHTLDLIAEQEPAEYKVLARMIKAAAPSRSDGDSVSSSRPS